MEGSGSQESQVSEGGIERRITEGAAYFAAMEVEPDYRPPSRTANQKRKSSSDSQFSSENSQSQSSQESAMVNSPPQSSIRVWPLPAEQGLRPSMQPNQLMEPRDEEMQPRSPRKKFRQENAVASSSRATSSSDLICPGCKGPFTTEGSLRRHRGIRPGSTGATNTKPGCFDPNAALDYRCNTCGYRTHRLDNLSQHQKKQHPKPPGSSGQKDSRTRRLRR